jgi:hypothetical protein
MDLVIIIFEAAGVNLCFLSAYSLKLNADEYIFHLIKDQVKYNCFQHDHLWLHTLKALAGITKETM